MTEKASSEEESHQLSFFERYLTIWVLICMGIGTGLGYLFPTLDQTLDSIKYAQVSLPIAVALFFMIYPIMVQIDFKKVIRAGKTPKPVGLTLFINWAIKPFTMALLAWLFMKVVFQPFISQALADQYVAGMILLGIAPCTAMVLVWSYLARGNMGHTLVMVAINSLVMLFLYAPLGKFLLGVANIVVPFATIAMTVGIYVGLPLLAGYISRKELIRRKGEEWFEKVFLKYTDKVSIIALLFTLIILF
ncbi:MAG: arsenic resistance protein, partial [Candidatus Bipolaricaulia bacterium]